MLTNGAPAGTSGRRTSLALTLRLVLILLIVLQVTANAVSYPRQSGTWQPWVWEYTSGLVVIGLLWPLSWVIRWAPPRPGGWAKFAVAHLAGSAAFSLVHTGCAVVLRFGIYRLMGETYGGANLLYEYRKDVATYALLATALWLGDEAARRWRPDPTAAGGRQDWRERLYDIRDGAKLTRTKVRDILAVSAARNYVEFHLANGARPLARTTLAAVEGELREAGFVRIHRSWLIDPRRIRTLTPTAGGDMRVELEGGLEAPLSRRFRDALEGVTAAPCIGPARGPGASAVNGGGRG